jgi:hypothetical protein
MPSTLTLSVIGTLSIAGAAVGVQLGHAAIGEINPAYFREPETPFHAALAANAPQDWDGVQAQEQAPVPITSCIGCVNGPPPEYPVDYVPGRDPYVDTAAVTRWPAPERRAAAAPAVETAQVVYAEAAPDPARERIVRYGSYPVTQEEAQAQAQAQGQTQAQGEREAEAPAKDAATQ